MNWKLFDIRVGRANRRQFFSVCLMFFGMHFLLFGSGGGFSALDPFVKGFLLSVYFVFSGYIVPLFSARRVRDTGYPGRWALIPYYAPFLLFALYFVILFFSKGYVTVFIMFIGGIIFQLYLAVMGLVCFLLFIAPGSAGENKYGSQPVGWDFYSGLSGGYKGVEEEPSTFHAKMEKARRELDDEDGRN